MPTALFLISVIISASFSLTFFRISQDQQINQALLQSTMSLYASNAHAEIAVSARKPGTSIALPKTIADREGEPPSSLADPMTLNQGIPASAPRRAITTKSDFVPQEYFDSGAEVFLADLKKFPADNIDFIRIEYCDRIKDQAPCSSPPELIVDWFELQSEFRFYDLAELSQVKFENVPLTDCLKPEGLNMRRCVIRTSNIAATNAVQLKNAEAESPYSKALLFRTIFPSVEQYLFRFRTVSGIPIHFRMMGQKGASGVPKIVQLPTAFLESDETATVRSSFRRIRRQQLLSAGLQNALEFVHYGEEVMNK